MKREMSASVAQAPSVEPGRVDITTSGENMADFSALLRRGRVEEAMDFLAKRNFYASADSIWRCSGGDEHRVSTRGGTMVGAGTHALGFVSRVYRQTGLQEWLRDGEEHHFFGRPRTPRNRLANDWRGKYALQHYDALERFDDAIALVLDRDLRIDESAISPELRAHIETNVKPGDRAHFAWLEGT